MITVTKSFTFDAAHILTNHSGLCKNLHGHTYRVEVSVTEDPACPRDMVIDFKDLKSISEEIICSQFDHAFIYNTTSPGECEIASLIQKHAMRTVALPFRSTAENLAHFFFDELRARIPELSAVTVWETATNSATYRAPRPLNFAQPFLAGRIATCALHAALSPRFAMAFDFLQRPDLADLSAGRYDIDGSNVYASISNVELTPFGAIQHAEVHRDYIDIQAPLDGPETYGILDLAGANLGPYDEEHDIAFGDRATHPLTLNPGDYVIFMPKNGAHAPCKTLAAEKLPRKKLVIKIRA